MQNENTVFVSICCMAYNQESFIRQTLDDFLMQQTNFGYEVIIHDDASTDSTANIIREYEMQYPDIIKPIYQTENQYSKAFRLFHSYIRKQKESISLFVKETITGLTR